MSWFNNDFKLTWTQTALYKLLKLGPIPRHVAFIMDGNRRYAKKNGLSLNVGHVKGFEALAQILQCSLKLGLEEVTVYAFSIENLKRSKEEVDNLMILAAEKFQKLLDEKDFLDKHKIRIKVWGNLELADSNLRAIIEKIMSITQSNNNAVMNICFFYTSTEELFQATRSIATDVQQNKLKIEDIKGDIVNKYLYSAHSFEVDLLIRTSGETRISDFLVWQVAYSCLYFSKILWPEFSVWHLLKAIFHYQFNYISIQALKSQRRAALEENGCLSDKLCA